MALISDYEIPGTDVIVPDAYHVVTNVDVEKRIADIPPPPDPSRPDGVTGGGHATGTEVHWKKGYVGKIAVTVWKDKSARDSGIRPVGYIGVDPTDNAHEASISGDSIDHVCRFMLDVDSEENEITQAYKHLKSLDYYCHCTDG